MKISFPFSDAYFEYEEIQPEFKEFWSQKVLPD